VRRTRLLAPLVLVLCPGLGLLAVTPICHPKLNPAPFCGPDYGYHRTAWRAWEGSCEGAAGESPAAPATEPSATIEKPKTLPPEKENPEKSNPEKSNPEKSNPEKGSSEKGNGAQARKVPSPMQTAATATPPAVFRTPPLSRPLSEPGPMPVLKTNP
jgi:hypothetical protein